MIRIEFENLALELISENDLEQIRYWRNQDHVRSNMDYQNLITAEEQNLWYSTLDKKKNLYFKIASNAQPIGVLNLKEIDWDNKTAQAGIFIGEKDHLSTMMPIIAVFILMKVAFDCFKIKELNAKIAAYNKNALNFNKQFGYTHQKNIKDGFDHFICTRDSFYSTGAVIKKLHELFNKNGMIRIYADKNSEWIHSVVKAESHHYEVIRL